MNKFIIAALIASVQAGDFENRLNNAGLCNDFEEIGLQKAFGVNDFPEGNPIVAALGGLGTAQLGNPVTGFTGIENPAVSAAVTDLIAAQFGASNLLDDDCYGFGSGSSTGTASVSTHEQVVIPSIVVTQETTTNEVHHQEKDAAFRAQAKSGTCWSMSGNLSELKTDTGAECGVVDIDFDDEGFDCSTRQTSGNRVKLETEDECIDKCADLETGSDDGEGYTFNAEVLIEMDPSAEIDERVYGEINKKISQIINQIISYSLSEAMDEAIDLDGMEDDADS